MPAPEGYWLGAEEVTTHIGGSLDGQTTWRLYINCLNETDYLSSVSGDDEHVFELNSTTSWHQDPLGVTFGSEANTAFYAIFPDLAFDSWLTIGAENSSDGVTVSSVTGETDPFADFAAGNNMIINDATGAAWFSPFPGAGATDLPSFAGADLKILVAQLTTDGDISGQMQLQIFMNADQSQEWRDVLPILFSNPLGCTDATACNYDIEATVDDGSCINIAEGECDCDGNVLDECGVCGGDGIAEGACDCDGNVLDECGVCGGDGIAEGACDCDGNVLDECGVCGGDGIADGACDCDGNVLDECGVCGGGGIADGDCD
ncbi:MAG TPA: hypothetical protein EYN67_18500, partial [Flavobacteriales bacterium]|nr:hypothetical protein [Flavobacteriales bacterium]